MLRVLRQPRGSAMLIGVGGSGKQSVTRLASHILECRTAQIEVTKGYGLEAFREFLQERLLVPCGVQGQQITFLFTDTQIVQESFLEDINNILNSGEVPNLLKSEDKEQILNDLRPVNA